VPLGEQLPQLGLEIAPGAHVERLFLHPDQLGCLAVSGENLAQLVPRESVQLLQADDGGAVLTQLLGLGQEVVVHLSGAHQHPPGALRFVGVIAVVDHRPEVSLG
jgi:hypothetical protein